MRCHDTGVGFYTSVSLILSCDALKYITHTFVRWVDWLPFRSFSLRRPGMCLWFIGEQSEALDLHHSLDAVIHSQLRKDIAHMAFDGVDREHQCFSNLLI